MEPVTQDMVKSGVVFDVILSVDEEPVSLDVFMSGVPGAASAVASMVMASAGLSALAFPDGSRMM